MSSTNLISHPECQCKIQVFKHMWTHNFKYIKSANGTQNVTYVYLLVLYWTFVNVIYFPIYFVVFPAGILQPPLYLLSLLYISCCYILQCFPLVFFNHHCIIRTFQSKIYIFSLYVVTNCNLLSIRKAWRFQRGNRKSLPF